MRANSSFLLTGSLLGLAVHWTSAPAQTIRIEGSSAGLTTVRRQQQVSSQPQRMWP